MDPLSLGIIGSTQPEVFTGTVDAMSQLLLADADQFWQRSLAMDGPVEVWLILDGRYLFNGNHRFQAALKAKAEIPPDMIRYVIKTGSMIPTFLLENLTWLPGLK